MRYYQALIGNNHPEYFGTHAWLSNDIFTTELEARNWLKKGKMLNEEREAEIIIKLSSETPGSDKHQFFSEELEHYKKVNSKYLIGLVEVKINALSEE